jgi:hypothetical protein
VDNSSKVLTALSIAGVVCGGYVLITFFNWHNQLEFKTIRVPNVQIGSTKEGANQNVGFGSAAQDYGSIVDTNDKNPETVKVSKDITPNLKQGICLKVSLEGYRSFYQQRWIKSVEKTTCP